MKLTGDKVNDLIKAFKRAGLNPKLKANGVIDDECRAARVALDANFDAFAQNQRAMVARALARHGAMSRTYDFLTNKTAILAGFDAFLQAEVYPVDDVTQYVGEM